MTHEQVVQARISSLRTRIRLLITQQWVCVGVTFAALAGLLLVAATRFQWWTDAIDYLWAVLLVGAITGLLIGWTRQITPMVAAQIADERAGLKERLSTAMEIAGSTERNSIAEAQLADAAAHAETLEVSRTLPWRAPKQLRYLAAAGALLAAVIFLPDLPIFQSKQDRLDREAMKKEGARIQLVAKEIEKKLPKKKKDPAEDEEIVRRVAAEMKKLGKEQAQGRISKKQAMLRMNTLQKQLKEAEQKAGGGEKPQKSSEQVSSQLQKAAEKQSQQGNNEAARALRQMADNVSKNDMEAAKRQLEELARKMQSGQMSSEEASKTAEMLKEMAKSMEGSNLDKASNEMKDAAKKLQDAAKQAQKFQDQMAGAKTDAERQQLQQQMAQALQQGAQQSAQQCEQAGGT